MKIQYKLFLFLFGFSLILVSVLVLLMQWSIGKGMVEYVATKEVETLKPVIAKLTDEYQIDRNWQSMTGERHKFRRLISQQFINSDFEQDFRKPPPERRRLSQPSHIPPS
jgi:two-component system sensor histidine kinase BaeS